MRNPNLIAFCFSSQKKKKRMIIFHIFMFSLTFADKDIVAINYLDEHLLLYFRLSIICHILLETNYSIECYPFD